MYTATAITVLDRAGTHTAIYVPPPSRQPRAIAKPSRFDRSAIMKAAWADFRLAERKGWTVGKFDRQRWSYCLSVAWMRAKAKVEEAATEAAVAERLAAIITAPPVAVVIADPVKQARVEAIRGELLWLEYSDATGAAIGDRELALKAELARLAA